MDKLIEVLLWSCVWLHRRSVISTGLQRDLRATSTSSWTPWLNTTCRSTSYGSLKSQTPGWVDQTWLYDFSCAVSLNHTLILSQDGQSRTIRQFQFTDWPEQGVPKTGEGFIDFIGQVHKTKEQFGQDGPITVHCRWEAEWTNAAEHVVCL